MAPQVKAVRVGAIWDAIPDLYKQPGKKVWEHDGRRDDEGQTCKIWFWGTDSSMGKHYNKYHRGQERPTKSKHIKTLQRGVNGEPRLVRWTGTLPDVRCCICEEL